MVQDWVDKLKLIVVKIKTLLKWLYNIGGSQYTQNIQIKQWKSLALVSLHYSLWYISF